MNVLPNVHMYMCLRNEICEPKNHIMSVFYDISIAKRYPLLIIKETKILDSKNDINECNGI